MSELHKLNRPSKPSVDAISKVSVEFYERNIVPVETEFWALCEALPKTSYNGKGAQLKDIARLCKLGDTLIQLRAALSAIQSIPAARD